MRTGFVAPGIMPMSEARIQWSGFANCSSSRWSICSDSSISWCAGKKGDEDVRKGFRSPHFISLFPYLVNINLCCVRYRRNKEKRGTQSKIESIGPCRAACRAECRVVFRLDFGAKRWARENIPRGDDLTTEVRSNIVFLCLYDRFGGRTSVLTYSVEKSGRYSSIPLASRLFVQYASLPVPAYGRNDPVSWNLSEKWLERVEPVLQTSYAQFWPLFALFLNFSPFCLTFNDVWITWASSDKRQYFLACPILLWQ